MSTPDRNAVHRQPRRVSPRTTTGVRSPPTDMPVELIDSASALLRRNQLTMATLIGRYPPRLEPSASMKNVRKNVTGEPIWLRSMKPTPKIVMPTRIRICGPKRSVSQP